MSNQPPEDVVTIVEDIANEFYRKLRELKLNDHHMASAYATLIRILMDTVAQNTSPLVAMKLVIIVIQRFADYHPGLNLMVHEQMTPPTKGEMQ